MGTVRRSAAVLAAGALLALVACGGENPASRPTEHEEPIPNISSQPSDGGGESDNGGDEPTQAAPNIPPPDPNDFPGMDQKTDEGTEQAARYSIQVASWAHQTGNSATYTTLYHEDCRSCPKLLRNIQKI